MNLFSVEHTHTLHSSSTQRQHLTQSGKVTKLILKKNDFHSPPLENNPVYEYIDYSKTRRYTINTFITVPNTE